MQGNAIARCCYYKFCNFSLACPWWLPFSLIDFLITPTNLQNKTNKIKQIKLIKIKIVPNIKLKIRKREKLKSKRS